MLFGFAYAVGTVVESAAKLCGAKEGARVLGAVAATFVGAADPIGSVLFCFKASTADDPDAAKVHTVIGTVMAAGGVASGAGKLNT